MVFLKFVGSWVMAMGALALINDVARTAGGAKLAFLSMRGLWQQLHESSLLAAQGLVERSLHPQLWDPVAMAVLKLPAWLVLGALGAVLCYLGRRRRRIELFTN